MQDKYRCFTVQNLITVQFIWHYSHLETIKINVQLTFLFEARLVSDFKTIHLFFFYRSQECKTDTPQNSFACQDRTCEKYGIQIC